MKIQVGKKYVNRLGECKTIAKSDNDVPQNRVVFDTEGTAYWGISGLRRRGSETPHDLVEEFQEGPIREITKREIVPGKYGCVVIGEMKGEGISICLHSQGHSVPLVLMDAAELDAAASVLTQIAAVLRKNQ